MTEPYARPADEAGDATIPIVPDAGYAPTEQLPFAEETLLDPTGASPWSANARTDPYGTGYGSTANPDTGTTPAAPPPYAQPAPPPYAQPAPPPYAQPAPPPYAQPAPPPYAQPAVPPPYAQPQAAQGPYGQPNPSYTQPVTTNYASTNYVQPQAAPGPGSYAPRPDQAGFAEPYGPAANIGPQNIYQGFPTSSYTQQPPALPAVIQDPVGYDYGYGRPAPAADHPNATISLVLGILGLVVFQPLAPVAWYLAAKGRREMAAFPGRWRPSGSLTAGFVMGIIGTVVLALLALGVLMMVVMLASYAG